MAQSHSLTVNSLQLDGSTVPLSDRQKPLHSPRQHTYCPWKPSLIKPPNPVTTSFADSDVSRRDFHRGYSNTGHLTHSVTPRLLQLSPFPSACFLCPYNYSLLRSQNCAVHPETKVKLTISFLCSNLSTGSLSHKEFSTR